MDAGKRPGFIPDEAELVPLMMVARRPEGMPTVLHTGGTAIDLGAVVWLSVAGDEVLVGRVDDVASGQRCVLDVEFGPGPPTAAWALPAPRWP